MNIPVDRKYTKDHEWVLIEGTQATMGITDFAQGELGDVVFVDLPPIGKVVKQKDVVCVVESTKAASDVYAPISGKIASTNAALTEAPETVNQDPYGKGWMAKLTDITVADAESLLTAEQYKILIKA